MHPIDFIKEVSGGFLPKKHLFAIASLLIGLAILKTLPNLQTTDTIPQQSPLTAEMGLPIPTTTATTAEPSPSDSPSNSIEQPAPVLSRHLETVKPGDNLSLIFDRAGFSPRDVYQLTSSLPDNRLLTNLQPGYVLNFEAAPDGSLLALEVELNRLESYRFVRNEEQAFQMEHQLKEPLISESFKDAVIDDSLFMAATKGGISAPLTMELADIFSGVIDFMLDTRAGDTFNLLYEEKYHEGEFIGNGAILAAQFTNQGETYTALRYVDQDGEVGYYNPQGESMKKAFLRNPIDVVRITSGFSLSRRHPILNTIRAHKGTDYAAPTGTPIRATSDGRVVWAARNGSFGKLVVIQHGERFQTKYAHLSDYGRGIKVGSRVRQGQVIGYVGATGSATGPHLHYEFLMDGVHRNYRTIHDQLPKAVSISEAEMPRFQAQTRQLLARLDAHKHPQAVAQNNRLSDSPLRE